MSRKKSKLAPLAIQVVALRLHVDRFVSHHLFALGGANVDADAAAGAVVGSDLDREQVVAVVLFLPQLRGETGRGVGERRPSGNALIGWRRAGRPARRGRSRCRCRIPNGDLRGDAPLFELSRAGGKRAVDGHRADGQEISAAGDDGGGDSLHEVGPASAIAGRSRFLAVAAAGTLTSARLASAVQSRRNSERRSFRRACRKSCEWRP